jgi:tripartite-type tricarboxylate transporter receptor subunit TctC
MKAWPCWVAAVLLLGLSVAAGTARAQAYPAKPVRIIVPYAAAGATDVVARVVAERLGESFQQRFLVENLSGGNANIGINYVAKAAPDGYTLLAVANAFTVNPGLMKVRSYDPVKDFVAISQLVEQPLFVVVRNEVPASSIEELIALLKANPGKYNYASSGAGGPQHMTAELFKVATETQIAHIPYRGAAPAALAILSGETQISFGVPTNTYPHVKSGRLRALATTTATRSEFAPELPTLAERGLAGFHYTSWIGILAPAGTPREIVVRLHQALARIVSDKVTKEKLFDQYMASVGSSPEEFAAFVRDDVARSMKIISHVGIQPE